MEKPKGIKISGIIALVISGLTLLSLILVLLIMKFSPVYNLVYQEMAKLGASQTSFIMWFIVWAVLHFAMVFGSIELLKYSELGRKLVVYASILFIVAVIWGIIREGRVGGIAIFSFAFYGWLIYYLTRVEIKKAFS
jgi:hypothetical protein